jgi:hypothetical protein
MLVSYFTSPALAAINLYTQGDSGGLRTAATGTTLRLGDTEVGQVTDLVNLGVQRVDDRSEEPASMRKGDCIVVAFDTVGAYKEADTYGP